MLALLVAALAVAAYLPAIGRQEWVGTEDFRARIAAENHAAGAGIVPTFYGTPILTKPPLYYWLLGGTLAWAGEHSPRVARLPSLAALAITAALLAFAGARCGGARCGLLAGAGYLLGLNTLKNGVNAEIDPLFAATAVAALLAWWHALRGGGGRWALVAGVALGIGGLLKGAAVLPVAFAGAAGGWAAGLRPRPYLALAAGVPMLAGWLAWPLALRGVLAADLLYAVRESEGFLTGWDAEAIVETMLFPFALLVAGLPLSLPALYRLRVAGRPLLDRYLVAAVAAFLIAMLPSATKATRYLLPCLPLLALAGALRLERLAASGAFARAVAAAALVAAAAAVPLTTGTLDLRGVLVLAALGLAALCAFRLTPRAPALALALLLLPARGLFTQVYVPAWEASGQAVAPAVAELRRLTAGACRLAVVRAESPRLTDPLGLDVRFFWDPQDLRSWLRDGREPFDAILLAVKKEEIELPGYAETGSFEFEGKTLRVLRPAG